MAEAAGPFLVDTLNRLESGSVQALPQDDSKASAAPKLTPEDGLIDFGFPNTLVTNFVRGLSSRPGAYTWFRGRKIKILGARQAAEPVGADVRPGTILPHKKRLLIACAHSAVELTRLVPVLSDGSEQLTVVAVKSRPSITLRAPNCLVSPRQKDCDVREERNYHQLHRIRDPHGDSRR